MGGGTSPYSKLGLHHEIRPVLVVSWNGVCTQRERNRILCAAA